MRSHIPGKLVTWKADKAFGFIRPDGGGTDVFVHLRDFGRIAREPRVGDVIRFQRVSDGTGRYRAADVTVEGLPRNEGAQRSSTRRSAALRSAPSNRELHAESWRWTIALCFAAALAALAVVTELPVIVLLLYVVASLVAVLLYVFDKAAAMNRRWRVRESTLLIAGLLGGWPGALVAQGLFRHKSRKLEFLVPFWMSVVINCAALIWACGSAGATTIRALVY